MAKAIEKDGIINICRNRRATFDYEILDQIECGLMLVGTEVKSLREGHAKLEDAYANLQDGELWLLGCEIAEYTNGNRLNHETKRPRKLLLRKREIAKFADGSAEKGFTLVPLRMYFKNGFAKVELAIGKGKQRHDKRESIKKNEAKREIDRVIAKKRRV